MTTPLRHSALHSGPLLTAVAALGLVALAGVGFGAVSLPLGGVTRELLDHIPGITLDSGLGERQAAILWELRLPRVVLAGFVGGTLAVAGAAYQGVFRNPLADPYLLGVAGGAGLGATIAIAAGASSTGVLPIAAFAGGMVAVVITYALGGVGARRSANSLILAGVAVAAFFAAMQTYVQQRSSDTVREVFTWILGRLATVGWGEVMAIVPFFAVMAIVLVVHRRHLDVLAVGEEEAATLGVHVPRVRIIIVLAATLGTAAAVSVSGLIGFVGIIVPHMLRLVVGPSYRRLVVLSMLTGGAFLIGADLLARTVIAPAELPIGVVTAFVGAPFFAVVLHMGRMQT
jgi:iron complex transport system permease protein